MKKNIYYLQILVSLVLIQVDYAVFAQNTATHAASDRTYFDALELYDKQKYGAAKSQFTQFINSQPNNAKVIEARYYQANCALNLLHGDTEALYTAFIKSYPEHSLYSIAVVDLGNYYFDNKQYDKVIEYYQTVDPAILSEEQRAEYFFKLGYSQMTKKDFSNAITSLNQSKELKYKYYYSANYYVGYLEFKAGDYTNALTDLNKASGNSAYEKLVPVLIANIYYRQGKYTEAIPYAENILAKDLGGPNTNDILLILADSYFYNNEFSKASESFKKYLKSTNNKNLTPELVYRIGYSSYKTGDFAQAIQVLKSNTSLKDSVGQASYYILGLSYIKSNDKTSAISAIEKTLEFDYNKNILEESSFLLGKLYYESKQFTLSTKVLLDYLKKYPNSPHYNEATEILTEAYLGSRNYDEALTFIDGLKSRTIRVNIAYQRIAYFKGIELFNNKKYTDAIATFSKSLKYNYDKTVFAKANYWLGESFSVTKEYEKSIEFYNEALDTELPEKSYEDTKIYYALGYSYYYMQKWPESIHSFKNFVSQKDLSEKDVYSIDATTRLADLYYVTRQFPSAITNYEKVKKLVDNDEYVLFQLATIYYLSNRTEFARAHYLELIKDYPKSNYLSNCYMQLGQIDLENSKYADAITQYTKVINQPIDEKGFKALAYQKRAMCYFNLKLYDNANADNKVLLTDYASTEEAYSALLNTQQILTIQDRTDEFEPILEKYKSQNPEGQDLREVEYSTSKSLYGNEKYEKAISGFQNLLQKYPTHPNKMEIEYYLADSYFKLKNWDKAIEYYTLVYNQKNSYYKKSLQRLAEANAATKKHQAAFNFWKALDGFSTSSKDKSNALQGMMISQYELAKYDSCIYYAKQLIEKGTTTPDAIGKSELYMGKSYYQLNDKVNAEDHFLICMNGAKDLNAAEAHYMLAQIQRDNGEFKRSNQTLYDFNNDYYNYDYWYGRSFLMLADNLISLNENFQAQETLESIVKGSKNTEIVEMAKLKLAAMKTKDNAPDGTNNE